MISGIPQISQNENGSWTVRIYDMRGSLIKSFPINPGENLEQNSNGDWLRKVNQPIVFSVDGQKILANGELIFTVENIRYKPKVTDNIITFEEVHPCLGSIENKPLYQADLLAFGYNSSVEVKESFKSGSNPHKRAFWNCLNKNIEFCEKYFDIQSLQCNVNNSRFSSNTFKKTLFLYPDVFTEVDVTPGFAWDLPRDVEKLTNEQANHLKSTINYPLKVFWEKDKFTSQLTFHLEKQLDEKSRERVLQETPIGFLTQDLPIDRECASVQPFSQFLDENNCCWGKTLIDHFEPILSRRTEKHDFCDEYAENIVYKSLNGITCLNGFPEYVKKPPSRNIEINLRRRGIYKGLSQV